MKYRRSTTFRGTSMSLIAQLVLTASGGLLAGIAAGAGVLRRQGRLLASARYDAEHDDITGLPNRRAFLTALDGRLRSGQPCGLVMADLDRFKVINDTLGHATGNHVLAEVGRRLIGLPSPVAVAARLSGDEYALLVDGDLDATAVVAQAAHRALTATPVRLPDRSCGIDASVGYTAYRLGVTAADLLTEADAAMYHAKRTGAGVTRFGHECALRQQDRPLHH
ncbi:GGDEF domain-containing protein [Asanoa sp. NPDC049573]|uniref:GGDEF domain-containing protein n=1 Tax=Asanoa sp. NPDC049573 TaxID=3155396 RepID=UPI0034251009